MIQKMQIRKILLTSSSHLVTDIYASFIIGMIPILTAKFGLSLFLVSLLTSISFVSANLTQPVFGYLSDRYGNKSVELISLLKKILKLKNKLGGEQRYGKRNLFGFFS